MQFCFLGFELLSTMPSFLSLCLALLRLAIRTTNRVQGLLIDLHNTVEWVIEQQGDPLQIRSSDGQSTSLTLPSNADTVPSEHVASPNLLAISTAEDNSSISMLESLRSQIFPSTREAPIISSTSKISKSVGVQSTGSNNSGDSSHPPLPEDEAKIKEIELTLKLFNKEPIIQPVITVSSKTAYYKHDSGDHSSTATSGIIRQSNEQSVVLQSISKSGTDAEDSHILKGNEFKWREYRMMLKWYRDEPVVSVPDGGLDENELEPLDLSTNSENLGDTIDPEEAANKPHSDLLPNLVETTKESEGTGILSLSESTPSKVIPEMSSAPTSSKKSTSSTSTTDRNVQGSIPKSTTSKASAESAKSKDDSKHKRGKSKNERSRHSSESTYLSKTSAPSGELETDVASEVKALPESLTREPWMVTDKASYDLDLKFERNLHLKEYDISTIREKGTSKTPKSPIRDSLTKKKHDIESNKEKPSQVRHSPSDGKKSGRTPVKSNEYAASPSAVALPQSLSLPRFCVDSSTGNVQWKSNIPPSDFSPESKQRSPFKQSNKSPKKTNLEIGTISAASIQNLNISTKKMESDRTTKVSESNSKSLPSETSTSEAECQFKPTRERRPTPPPARFPEVETSTDSEKVDSQAKSLSFCTEPIKMSSVESELKSTRERRPTPAARFPTNEFSANKDESDEKSKLAISLPVEALKLKEKSPLKSQQKRIPTTEVGFTVQSSPRRKNVVDDRPERFSPSRNQSIGIAERVEFTSRERRPTPAVRFSTHESTESETVGKTPTQHALQSSITESFTKNEAEPNPTCERMSSSVPEITITRSPTRREDEVSVKSKLASRLVRKSSTSPRSSGKSHVEGKTSPTVRFRIPESQVKRENTGTTRKEYKLALRKTAKEMSTSEEEYDSKHSLSMKRRGSPAKYPFFKSPRMLEDAAAAARSLNFSPPEMPIEKEVETRPPCQGNTFADSLSILEKFAKNEHPHSDSSSSGSLRTVLLDRININDEGVLIHGSASAERRPYEEESYSTTFEGDSAPEGAACSGPRLAITAPHNSPINFKVTDEPSTEMSQSESTTGSSSSDEQEEDSAIDGVSERPSAEDIRFLRQAGFRIESDSNSSDSTTNETSIGYGSGGDSAPEGTARLFPQNIPEPLNIAENVETSRNNSTDGSRRDSVPEARVYIYGYDFTLSESSTETSANNMSGEDSSPEETAGLSSQVVGIESPSKSTCSATEEGLLSENSRSVSDAENVDTNARLDFILSESSTVMVSSHASEDDSAPEGTKELFPEPNTTESPVNAKINKVELGAENDFALTESTSQTSTGDGFSRGSLAFEKTSPLKSPNESSSKTRAEKGTSLEADSTSSEYFKYEGARGESDPESTETPFLQTSTKEFPTNANDSKDTSSEMYFISSNAKLSETSTSEAHGGTETAPEEVTDLYKLPEIGKSSNSDEKSKDEHSAENDSTSSESTKIKRILKTSSGDCEPKEASDPYSQPEKKEFSTNVEDSDDTSSETDSTSSESTSNEKSSSDGSGDDSATGGAPNLYQEPETSKSPANTGEESKDELNTGAGSSSSEFTAGDTSTSKQFEGDSALEETTDNCPRVESGKSQTDSRNANSTGTDSTVSDYSQSRTSRNEGATGGYVPEESTGHNPHIETRNSSSANDTNGVRSEYGQAYVVELPSTDAENISPDRLSTIHEVSTNGTTTDTNYSDAENGNSISSPSELSSEDAGEFILEQDSDNHSEFCITPTNGDISSESEDSFRQECDRNEYLHDVESSEEICEWPTNEKETGKTPDSNTISSLSSPSKSANSEEESEHARIKIENTSEPNSDKSETCNEPILSLNTETKNIDEDRNVKVQSVCLQDNECLEVSDCEANAASLLVDTVQRITEGNILQENVSQTPSQILDTDFNSNSDAASCSLSNTEEKTSCDVSVDSNNTDKTKMIQVPKTQAFISEASACMKIKTKVVSEKESTTGLGDTLVSSREICSSMLAQRDTFALLVSAAEMKSSNSVGDSQVEICSVKESVTEKVIEASRVFVQDASSECEEVCENNTITEELTDSPLLASDINILDCEMANTAENNGLTISIATGNNLIAQVATHKTCMASKEHASQSVSDNKEQSESTPKSDDGPDLGRATSPLTLNIQASSSSEQVDTKNGTKRLQWFVGKKLIKLDSAKHDVAEVSTRPFIYEATAKSAKTNEDLNSSLPSGTLVDKPHKNADYSEATDDSALEDSTARDTSSQVFSIAQKETSNDPVSNLFNTLAEKIVDDSNEKSESIIYKDSTDVHDVTADSSDSRNTLKCEWPITYSTIARSEEMGDNLDPEEIIDSGEDFSESKESGRPQLSRPNTKSASDCEIIKNCDIVSLCDSSNDCAEHSKPEDDTEFEVYIAPEPVTGDIAFGSAIEVLDSYLPDTCYIEKIQDSTLSATEFDSCEKPFTKQDGQDFKNNFGSQSESCDTPTTVDIVNESSITKSHFASMESSDPTPGDVSECSIAKSQVASMGSGNPTTADISNGSSISETRVAPMDSGDTTGQEESTTSVQIDVLVPNVWETLSCEVSKNCHIESDNAVQESTSRASSSEVSGSLDSAQCTDKMPEDNEKSSSAKVENKAWKKKPRKPKKQRKH